MFWFWTLDHFKVFICLKSSAYNILHIHCEIKAKLHFLHSLCAEWRIATSCSLIRTRNVHQLSSAQLSHEEMYWWRPTAPCAQLHVSTGDLKRKVSLVSGSARVLETYLSLTQDVLFTCMTRLKMVWECMKLDSPVFKYTCCKSIYCNKRKTS